MQHGARLHAEPDAAGLSAGLHLAFAVLVAGAAAFALGAGADAGSVGLLAALCALPVLGAGLGALWGRGAGWSRDVIVAGWGLAAAGAVALAGAGGPLWAFAPIAPIAARLAAPHRPVWDACLIAAVAGAAGAVAGWYGPLAGGALIAGPWFAAAAGLFALTALGASKAQTAAPAQTSPSPTLALSPAPVVAAPAAADPRLALADLGQEARLLLDADGLLVAAAGPVATRLGTLAPVGTSPGLALLDDAERAKLAEAFAEAVAGREAERVVRLAAPAGRRVLVTAAPAPAGSGGAATLVIRDVEDALAADEAAAARAEARKRWIGELGHEMRTPLNAVIGYSDVMQQGLFGALPERYAAYPGIIHRAGRHLDALIADAIDKERLEDGRTKLDLVELDVAALAAEVLEIVRPKAEEAAVTLTGPAPGATTPVLALADARAVRQILTNLTVNAVRYTPQGGSVDVRVRLADDQAIIEVEDTGIGIPEELLARLGETHTVGPAVEGRSKGTGVGLALVRRLVAQHMGRLRIETAPGAGTLAEVRLPAAPLSGAQQSA